MAPNSVRIRLRSYDATALQATANEIIATARRTGAKASGPIAFRTRIERYTVNRSPHVDKKSREQFEIRTHKRLIEIRDPTPQTADALARLELDALVEVQLELPPKAAEAAE